MLHLRTLLLLLLCSCSVSRAVRPVGAGNVAVGGSVGGPIFRNLGPPVPVPITEVYGRYGLTDSTDVDVGLMIPVVRAIGLDAGVAHQWWKQSGKIPMFSTGARLGLLLNSLAIIGKQNPDTGTTYALDPRVYEEIYGTLAWQVAPTWLLYTGLDLFAQVQDAVFRPSVLTGTSWRVAEHWDLTLEGKWTAFATNQANTAVDWAGIDSYGAFAAQLGAMWYWEAPPP